MLIDPLVRTAVEAMCRLPAWRNAMRLVRYGFTT